MQQLDTLTAEDWKAHSETVQQGIFDKLDRLEEGKLAAQERETLCEQVRTEIRQLKREYNRMIGCMAEAATSIDEMETRLKEYERVTRRRFHLLPPAPTNAQIDLEEKNTRHFAQGKSFFKLFWVFFIGCFLGVMVERVWCLVRYGHYEPRVGLIYGPFNLVYGIGAWALTLSLYPFRNRSKIFSFLGGAWLPLSYMPDAVKQVSALTPAYWANQPIREAFQSSSTSAEALAPLYGDIGVCALFAVAITAVGMAVGRARLRSAAA